MRYRSAIQKGLFFHGKLLTSADIRLKTQIEDIVRVFFPSRCYITKSSRRRTEMAYDPFWQYLFLRFKTEVRAFRCRCRENFLRIRRFFQNRYSKVFM